LRHHPQPGRNDSRTHSSLASSKAPTHFLFRHAPGADADATHLQPLFYSAHTNFTTPSGNLSAVSPTPDSGSRACRLATVAAVFSHRNLLMRDSPEFIPLR